MANDGPELPRPPRRVPPGGGTAYQPFSSGTPVSRRPWYLIPVVLAVLAASVGSAWLAREWYDTVDPAKAAKAVGPAVVTVLATSCEGTGRATGVLIGRDRVVTVASAIKGPVAVAIKIGDAVRRVRVLGASPDGVAVLQVQGPPLGVSPVRLFGARPKAGAEFAMLGRTDDGAEQVSTMTVSSGVGLTTTVNEASLGAPLVDARNRVAGIVVSGGPGSATMLEASAVSLHYGGTQLATRPLPGGNCKEAKGPESAVTPELLARRTPLAEEALETMTQYVRAVNRHEFEAVLATYTNPLRANSSLEQVAKQHRTTYLFDAKLRDVVPIDSGAQARMTFTTISHTDGPAKEKGYTCAQWELVYPLRRAAGQLRIAGTRLEELRNCDG